MPERELPPADIDVALFEYSGFCGLSACRIRIYIRPDRSVVVATWDAISHGTSITNAAERVATEVARQYALASFIWIEHYDYGRREDETFDLVTFGGQSVAGFHTPSWRHLGRESALELIGAPAHA